MRRFAMISLVLLSPMSAFGQDEDAKKLAQGILDKGAVLFGKRDAEAMTRTYTEGARVVLISKDKDTQEYKADVREGRAAIHDLYSDAYKNTEETITSRNTVEFARRVAPDLLVIHGMFEPNVGKGSYPFVQVRKKEGDKWLILSLQLYIVSQS
jgi:hypothetical protein